MTDPQRRSFRKSLQADFRAREAEGDGVLLFEAADVSSGGAFLKSDLLLEQGDPLALEFRIPGLQRLLRAQGRIAWVRRFPEEGQPAGMGVEFLGMTEEDRLSLRQYLEQALEDESDQS